MHPNKNKNISKRIDPIVKPELLRNNEWQALLRKQFAHIQKLKVVNTGIEKFYSEFEVTNPHTKNKYKVAIRSITEPKNFCTCYDFKTNKLGTCKHIEAVFFYLESIPNAEIESSKIIVQKYSSVYIDYLHHRCISMRIGTENSIEIKTIFQKYFDATGKLLVDQIIEFCGDVEKYASELNIRIYDDAKQLLDSMLKSNIRMQKLSNLDITTELENLVNIKLNKHQAEGVNFALLNAKTILNFQFGIGLGITAISAILIGKKIFQIKKVLIVTNDSEYWNHKVHSYFGNKPLHIVGNDSSRKKIIDIDTDAVKLIHPEDAATDLSNLNRVAFDLIIIDDATIFENLNSHISRQLKQLTSDFLLVLATNDLTQNLESFYSQIQVVDMFLPGSLFNFLNRYAIKNAQGKIVATKNKEELDNHLKNVYLQVRFSEIKHELNSPIYKNVFIKLFDEQENLYHNQLLEISKNFDSLSDENKIASIENDLCLATSAYLYNKSNIESKLFALTNLLSLIKTNQNKILVISKWPNYCEFIETYLLQSHLEVSDDIVKIVSLEDLNQLNFDGFEFIICLDIVSNTVVKSLLHDYKLVVFTLIADKTFESYLSIIPKLDFNNLINEFGYFIKKSTVKSFNHQKNIEPIQLSFIGDDDIINTSKNNEINVENLLHIFEDLNKKLLDKDFRIELLNSKKLPKKLKQIIDLYNQ